MHKKSNLIITFPQEITSKCSERYKNKFMSDGDDEKLRSVYFDDPHLDYSDNMAIKSFCLRTFIVGIVIAKEITKTKDNYLQDGDSTTYFYNTKDLDSDYMQRYISTASMKALIIFIQYQAAYLTNSNSKVFSLKGVRANANQT